ncbi:hypothetical protein BZL30_3395 [Mycobacterium kansasii]|uniref:Uncharacterized protein n=1 Tax=Mycobacterium kansasii TaxID=1768 RepID=A0A1V3X3B6_MYCKA|nr:hypothetical protein BZL29_5039 [Mycobacterium kansasii]OOK75858.1 hypothetical protein BZL30_3395 [Mycobacterium kansasii]
MPFAFHLDHRNRHIRMCSKFMDATSVLGTPDIAAIEV